MTVTELANYLATTADTVRYYTRLKLLNPTKSANGYKAYSGRDVKRLKFILSARHLGFTVSDIETILAEADHGKTVCSLARELIKRRLEETEKQFQAMLQLRERVTLALEKWQDMDNRAPSSDMVCHLIEGSDKSTIQQQ
ncbi:MerR family transcriptional regulator [Thalassotalea sp. Y01]|uniref:MerR family transcriptional regulator n=1 Tax=Thalassotalea sp. Y01 TaxID=2729613 RepID=UPI00145D2D31|nr:MerR family transcriptional regulator [Thalassotalea sp. Y01]NMP14968.1 MerR family DNA-binding protein [Thalassotalea sp. Y01]